MAFSGMIIPNLEKICKLVHNLTGEGIWTWAS